MKLTVSVALLTYLLRQADFEGIWQSTQNAQWSLIAVVFLLFFLHFYIGALRWNWRLSQVPDPTTPADPHGHRRTFAAHDS